MTTNNYRIEAQTTTSDSTMSPPGFEHWTDDELLDEYGFWQTEQAFIAAKLGRIEQDLVRRMKERSATAIPSETFIVELKVSDTYDQVSFGPLKEVFHDSDLATCFTPAHEETVQVPDKWNTVKVKALARRYGKEALAVIERAKIAGAPRLVFKRRE